MQGVSKSGKSFGDITGYRIGGQVALGTNHFVTEEKMNEETRTATYRRGSSVHWFYTQPTGNAEYFYNEVLVTPEKCFEQYILYDERFLRRIYGYPADYFGRA